MPRVLSFETPSSEPLPKYFNILMKAWTTFDPKDMELGDIAARIQLGAGVVTAVEVTRVADKLDAVDDDQVRLQFQMLIVTEHIIQNAAALPLSVRNRLIEALSKIPREYQSIQH